MSRKIVVGFDGSDASIRALDFAISRAQAQGDHILIAHVLEWSPYSFLTKRGRGTTPPPQGGAAARRSRHPDPHGQAVEDAGIPCATTLRYGHIAETLCRIAKDEGAAMIFIGRMGDSGFASRIFGSVAATLAQVAPVPVVIVP